MAEFFFNVKIIHLRRQNRIVFGKAEAEVVETAKQAVKIFLRATP